MNKPDGITQDAWDRALTCVDLYLRDVDMSPQEAIARAIQSAVEAERERCAKVAEAYPFRRWEQDEPDKSVYGWGRCRTEIAAAIRKGA